MHDDYEGEERRKHSQAIADHGILLTKIDTNLENFIRSFEHHENDFKDHKKDDDDNFKEIERKIAVLQRYVYIGIGILIVLEVVLKLIPKGQLP